MQGMHAAGGTRLLLRFRAGWESRHHAQVKRSLLRPFLGDTELREAADTGGVGSRKLLGGEGSAPAGTGCMPELVDLHAVQLQIWELPPGCDVAHVAAHLAEHPGARVPEKHVSVAPGKAARSMNGKWRVGI